MSTLLSEDGETLGPCPDCEAMIQIGVAKDPQTGIRGEALIHKWPACKYFAATSAMEVINAMIAKVSN